MDTKFAVILGELKSRTSETRDNGVNQLFEYVQSWLNTHPPEAAPQIWNEVNKDILFPLTSQSSSTWERLGGIAAIDKLLALESEATLETKRNLYRLLRYLKNVLPTPEMPVMNAAASTFGKILQVGGPSFTETVLDEEVQRAVGFMTVDKTEYGRYAGIIILIETATHASGQFYKHINQILEKVVTPMRDPRETVRKVAATLLSRCLTLVANHDKVPNPQIFTYILLEAQKGITNSSSDVIQGSLLIYRELLMSTNMFMEEHFADTCEKILSLRQHKDLAVRKTVTNLLPVCARYDPTHFNEQFLYKTMGWLLPQLAKPAEKQFVLEAIGPIALSVTSEMRQFMPAIMAQIKESLAQRNRRGSVPDKVIFECISMLAAAVGPNLTKLLHDQLDLIFAYEFNEYVRSSLAACAKSIPPLLRSIQDRLLDKLSLILSGESYRPSGAPLPSLRPELPVTQVPSSNQYTARNPESIQLALDTLATFDFSGHQLNDLVRTCALPYLEDAQADIRLKAAITCCRLFMQESFMLHHKDTVSLDNINEVLEKLLMVSIADTDPNIRTTVLSSLHERFDKYLSQPEHIRLLFMALNDEVYEVRYKAIEIIGRIGYYNPAHVMPSLRKTLIQLLTELEYTSSSQEKSTSAEFLTSLIRATNRLIKPYTLTLLRVVLPKASDTEVIVSRCMIECIGLLAMVGGEDMATHVPEIMSILLAALQDPLTPTAKRDAALLTMGQLCANTSYVVDPLVEHPELFTIFARLLKTDTSAETRREVLRLLGILGAVDPYMRRKRMAQDDPLKDKSALPMKAPMTMAGMSSEEYFQTVVMAALLNILHDGALTTQYLGVVEVIMTIFKNQGLKCVAYLPQILPAFINVTRISNARHQDWYLQQLASLTEIITNHVRPFVKDILDMCRDLWINRVLHLQILALIDNLARVLDTSFKPHLPSVLPMILSVSKETSPEKRQATEIRVFNIFLTFSSNVEEYMHIVLPFILSAVERPDASPLLRKTALKTIAGLAKRVNISDYASRIVHPLVRLLPGSPQDVREAIRETMCALVFQLGADFAVFIPLVKKSLLTNRIDWPRYEQLIAKLLNGERLPIEHGQIDIWSNPPPSDPVNPAEASKLVVNQQHLKQAWDVSRVESREDWQEWFKKFSTELLRESMSPALRACVPLVDTHPPLGLDLFNAAFISCWTELYDQYQDDLVASITRALSTNKHSDLTLHLLNLVEFMEHEDRPLPIDNSVLGRVAEQANAYAKAMHYKEVEYFSQVSPELVESLVSISTKLQLQDVAWAILKTNTVAEELKLDRWYERLGRWQEALEAYDRRPDDDSQSQETVLGRMRCLHALGEWEVLNEVVESNWGEFSPDTKREIAPLAAAASFNLYQWDIMEEHVGSMSADDPDRSYYRAVLAVHRNQFSKAHSAISKARDILQSDLAGIEDYTRVYGSMIRVQLLSELEEIMEYKKNADQPDRLDIMRKTWSRRLQGCQRDIDVWRRILQLRGLVLNPDDDVDSWIRLANLCRKSDRIPLADKALKLLLPDEHPMGSEKASPAVVYATLKVMWSKGRKQETFEFLRKFCSTLARDVGGADAVRNPSVQENRHLLARSYLKQGEWQKDLTMSWTPEVIEEIINCYQLATEFDPTWSKAWHSWALCNFEAINHLEGHESEIIHQGDGLLLPHILSAIKGFFRSIALRSDNPLQDSLRILTLWFKFGTEEDVTLAVSEGASMVSVDTWLDVIPQLIARIQTPLSAVRVMINTLLTDVGRAHPQALIYPLTVASKSESHIRRNAAALVMDRLRDHSPQLVEQSLTVSHELIRVAILWHELWHEHLEEASRLYFTEKNPDAMIAHLETLHQLMAQGPETSRETAFLQVYGKDLREARDACMRFSRYRDNSEMDQAWEIYYGVFRRIERQLPQLTTLDLQYVSPKLLVARDLELAVPGTYRVGKPVIKISKFSSRLSVISSKQRPRRLSIVGSDGVEYQFGLKGHEDLRQDERVMQLFGLVNTLLAVDNDSFMRNLHIQRYAVIPLAANVGLIQWVLHSDTLHVLIKDFRDSRKILLNFEYRLMLQMAPDYPSLTLLQKVEVFRYALDNTTGQDLYRILWLKSASSAAWLERRSTFTRSLAVNSMVGHILGLGDRHPSNFMIERNTGQIVHIDFGDCFEVAMHREKFPERIPFRLTRMLTNAMEVSGIEGNFRNTAQISMRVLRENNDSLMAVLEAFVYDPLISWRLTAGQEGHGADADAKNEQNKLAQFAGGPKRKLKADENDIFENNGELKTGGRIERALAVYSRVQKKLTGRDFNPDVELTVNDQVEKLIQQATAVENLCQCFLGWCAFW